MYDSSSGTYDIGPGPGPITSAQPVVIIGGRTSGVFLIPEINGFTNKQWRTDESLDFFKVDTYVYANSK